jgi:hypothetical protein
MSLFRDWFRRHFGRVDVFEAALAEAKATPPPPRIRETYPPFPIGGMDCPKCLREMDIDPMEWQIIVGWTGPVVAHGLDEIVWRCHTCGYVALTHPADWDGDDGEAQ